MDELTFLQDMAIVMAVSAAIMIFCQRFRLPVVLGYILAGAVIGPNTPPFPLVKDLHSIHTLSEMGVIFLLFSIGLEFSIAKLARVGLVSFFAATLEIILMIWIGFSLGKLFGWNTMNSLFLGAILSVSSTTIIAKVLMETKKIKEKFAQVILGILIIEDLLAIIIIALLSGVASTGSLELREVAIAMARVLSFIACILFFGFLLVPRLLKYITRFESSEMLVITVLGLCFGVSLLAAKFGFSVALGAFLIGAVIAETKQATEIVHKIEPIRDMFTAIFFVSVGMLLSPETVMQFWGVIVIITLVTIVGKVVSCSIGTFLMGYPSETALKVGLGLAQIGEFSFIIAQLGETTGVTSPYLYPIAVSVSGITTLSTPFLMRNTTPIIRLLDRLTPRPLATVLSLYTGWFQKIGEVSEERKAKFRFWGFILTVLAVLAMGASFLPGWRLRTVVVGLMLAPGIFLWRSMEKVHKQIEKTILGIFDPESLQGLTKTDAVHHELQKLIHEEYPWEVNTEDFLLPYHESALNQSIQDLRLRSETGATIVSIYKGKECIPNPPADTKLVPGDVLLLMGDTEQIKAAIRFLSRKAKEPALASKPREGQPKTQLFKLTDRSALAGKTLREIKLRRKTGVTILGLQKGDISINNPDPDTAIEAGDALILFGWPDQLESAFTYLASSS